MMSRTSIGGMLLDAVEGWTFSVQEGAVNGRRGEEPGVLRIWSISADQLHQPLTHAQCLELAAQRADVPAAQARERQMMHSVMGPYGSASFHRGKDKVCVWYCGLPSGLIIGAYACAAELCRSSLYRNVRAQCGQMITSALFDRRAWGGDDELTKFVSDELAAEERKNTPPAAPLPRPSPRHDDRGRAQSKGN